MPINRFVIHPKQSDPRSTGYVKNARALGFNDLRRIMCHDLYFIEGQLSQEELQQLALKLLTDPVVQAATWDDVYASSPKPKPVSVILEVSLRPGVTDPVATEIVGDRVRGEFELSIPYVEWGLHDPSFFVARGGKTVDVKVEAEGRWAGPQTAAH